MTKCKFLLISFIITSLCIGLTACGSNPPPSDIGEPAKEPVHVFTNHQGTVETICKKEGCTKYIAEYGDTLFCPEHSERCILCGTYISAGNALCGWCSNSTGYEDKSENIYGQSYYAKIFSSPTPASFTNKYGTPSTKCAHPGCNSFIAPSGDTNCCISHSQKCASCGRYIDEDATFCMDCIERALN